MTQNKKDRQEMKADSELSGTDKKNKRKTLIKIFFFLASLFILALIFNASMLIIGVKTDHFQRWAGEQYFGEIIEVKDDGFLIQGRDNEKRTVLVTQKTVVKKGPDTVQSALKIGEKVMIFGPNDKDGRIDAQLIRIFDPNDPTNKFPKFLKLSF